ncbi:MAG: hypothetical protein CMI21_06975 [Opitutae bacterium]|nr:hypothetical protein [Opitutae bacterium]|tara:strand:+ start:219 stop:671 length:453 start_codon:yes stop_codon:yes gene_type:complete
MISDDRPSEVRPLFEIGSELPPPPDVKQEIGDRKSEAKRVIKRLFAIFEEHREAALPLEVKLGTEDLSLVIEALRDHARGGPGAPVSGSRDEVHGHCLNRLFDELVEEPSNILFTTKTGAGTIRYDAMNATFWIECLDLMESTFCNPEES